MITPVIGRPGIQSGSTVSYRQVFANPEDVKYHPGGGVLAAAAQDWGNTPKTTLRGGLLVGRVTSTKKWLPSLMGKVQSAYASGTSLTLTAASALELVRRVGTTGTFGLVGPPTANGTARIVQATFSAVDTSTGVVTITALPVADVWTLTAPAGQDAGMYQLEVTTGKGTSSESTQVTAALAANANSATVDAALEALTNVGASGVAAVYADPTLTLTFAATLGPVHVRVLADTTNDGGVFEGGWAAVHTTVGVDGRFVAGSFVLPEDGSQYPRSVVPSGSGIQMTADNSADVDFPQIPVAGMFDSDQIVEWPSDTGLQDWIRAQLNTAGAGRFQFDDLLNSY